MADDRDEVREAEKEAEMASAFFGKLIAEGKSERIAAELTCAYILGRQRRERRESWESGDR